MQSAPLVLVQVFAALGVPPSAPSPTGAKILLTISTSRAGQALHPFGSVTRQRRLVLFNILLGSGIGLLFHGLDVFLSVPGPNGNSA